MNLSTKEGQLCVGSSAKADCPRAAERHSAYEQQLRSIAMMNFQPEDDSHARSRAKGSAPGPQPLACGGAAAMPISGRRTPQDAAHTGRWPGPSGRRDLFGFRANRSIPCLADARLLVEAETNSGYWSYAFGDGWVASVTARILAPREKPKKSDGFSGYDWMVDSIIVRGSIRPAAESNGVSR